MTSNDSPHGRLFDEAAAQRLRASDLPLPDDNEWDDHTRMWSEIDLDYRPRVCIVHLRFVPCRAGEAGSVCVTSIRSDEVGVVRAYQHGEISERDAHMKLDTLSG